MTFLLLQNVRIIGDSLFYRVTNLPIEISCIIKNFEEETFSDFKRLVVTFKINPQAPVVRKVDSDIHWINHYTVDSVACFVNTYPLDSDLSGG